MTIKGSDKLRRKRLLKLPSSTFWIHGGRGGRGGRPRGLCRPLQNLLSVAACNHFKSCASFQKLRHIDQSLSTDWQRKVSSFMPLNEDHAFNFRPNVTLMLPSPTIRAHMDYAKDVCRENKTLSKGMGPHLLRPTTQG